jgi:hypothetical protein
MIRYDKDLIKKNLTVDQIYSIFEELGADPILNGSCIVGRTICHNGYGEGSHKLYYYFNSQICHCYTGCAESSFDIFELIIKAKKIQQHLDLNLYNAMQWLVSFLNLSKDATASQKEVIENKDWEILDRYESLNNIQYNHNKIILPEYDFNILNRLNYQIKIKPWLDEDITQESMDQAKIGYYAGNNQITIPHYDIDGRFIGLRGRTLSADDAEAYGKYRPIKINNVLYNHPLGLNLYNLNNSKNQIKIMQKAIVLESEKSCLKYQSYFGIENDISVACCGSNISNYQIQLLIEAGAKEIVIAFDRQFQDLNTTESKIWIKKLQKIHEKYKNDVIISLIFDKNKITNYKSSPVDEGPEKFLQLYKERIIL